MEEYLGAPEVSLVDFVLRKLKARAGPEEIVEELEPVLDDDAQELATELYKRLETIA